jgi:hypothetical protein
LETQANIHARDLDDKDKGAEPESQPQQSADAATS